MGGELLFVLLALTPIAVGAGLIGGDASLTGETDEFGANPDRVDDLIDGEEILTDELPPLVPSPPEGADTLAGTEEDDILSGTDEDELLLGDAGDDSLSGGAGDDYLQGDDGMDSLSGEGGNDVLLGEGGSDILDGGDGNDVLAGGDGADTLQGGAGSDVLIAGEDETDLTDETPDTLDGGDGNDALYFGEGDVVTGGAGADVFAPYGNAVVSDFDPAEDVLVIRYIGEELFLLGQDVTDAGLEITVSNGTSVTLQGVENPLDPDNISFVAV